MRLRLKRRTSINSQSQFHKEKEMADFRKWFLAFAVVALLSSFAAPAFAQTGPAITCGATAGVPPVIRSEGVAELVGDVVLNCTGGVATPGKINVQIFLNSFVTSKLLSDGYSDALLLVGEPSGAAVSVCPVGSDCSTGAYNAFRGQLQNLQTSSSGVTGYTSIVWTGIPFTPPGSGTVALRITNVRGDALSAPPAGGQFIPQTIQEFIAINGVSGVAINPSQLTVAYLQPGVLLGATGTGNFVQCLGRNVDLLNTGAPADVTDFVATLTEGFASSFKTLGTTNQNMPGTNYFTENGFTLPGGIGTATQATEFFVNMTGLASGVSVFLPTSIPLVRASDGVWNGTSSAILVTCDSTGTTCTPATATTTNSFISTVAANLTANQQASFFAFFGESDTIPLTSVDTTGNVYYQVVSADPFTVEAALIPVTVAFQAGLPPTTASPTLTVGLAPQNTDVMALSTDPIPRFGPSSAPAQTLPFPVGLCQCNLLFPYVTSRANFDTGIAVSNTSMDPWNNASHVTQHGTITFHFYGDIVGAGGGTPTPLTTAQQTGTSPDVPAGTTYAFTVYNGDATNGANVTGLVGFSGYVIASANFQFCHGYAYISGFGRGAFDQGASEGYLGLVLDTPLPPSARNTGAASESLSN
jgi:hypothetical protein